MFGERVRALRMQRGMTQEELAEKTGVTKRTIINYEQGRSSPRDAAVIQLLAREFGVTADYLLGQEPRRRSPEDDAAMARKLAREVSALFAGGRLREQDQDAAMEMIMKAYWDGKKR